MFGVAVLAVVGITAAGVAVVRSEFSGWTSPFRPAQQAQARKPYASEVARAYLDAFSRGDAQAAAVLTDDPVAAELVLGTVLSRMAAQSIDIAFDGVQVGSGVVDGRFRVRWHFPQRHSWGYANHLTLLENAEGWVVRWTPALVHPALRSGHALAVRTRSGRPAVLDADGKAIAVWRGDRAQAVSGYPVPVMFPGLAGVAQDRVADDWAVVLVDEAGHKIKVLYGKDPATTRPLRSTIKEALQRAAQKAVDTAAGAATLVALKPSTGDILAVAQNRGAEPVALSGLYPPGSVFKMATAAAALKSGATSVATRLGCPGEVTIGGRTIANDDRFDLGKVALRTAFARSCNTTFARLAADLTSAELVEAADRLGLNADFAVPGVATELGTVVPADTEVQRIEDGIGQGDVVVTPFGAALMAATVSAGRAVVPKLWNDIETSVLSGYRAPDQATIRALRSMMRAVVTGGTATALRPFGAIHGKTGTAETEGKAHGWFVGYSRDLAFSVLAEQAGSSDAAVDVTADFLRALPR